MFGFWILTGFHLPAIVPIALAFIDFLFLNSVLPRVGSSVFASRSSNYPPQHYGQRKVDHPFLSTHTWTRPATVFNVFRGCTSNISLGKEKKTGCGVCWNTSLQYSFLDHSTETANSRNQK